MKTNIYTGSFFRAPLSGEIGPQSEIINYAATSKAKAIEAAKLDAKRHDWRFLEVEQTVSEPAPTLHGVLNAN